jgi:hypothetical protein
MAPCRQQDCTHSAVLDQRAGMLEQTHGHVAAPDHDGSRRKDGNSDPSKLVPDGENLEYDGELGAEELAEEKVLGRAVLSIWPFGHIELSLTEDPSKANRKVRNPPWLSLLHLAPEFVPQVSPLSELHTAMHKLCQVQCAYMALSSACILMHHFARHFIPIFLHSFCFEGNTTIFHLHPRIPCSHSASSSQLHPKVTCSEPCCTEVLHRMALKGM